MIINSFFDVVIQWPGSVHDARMFSNSSLNLHFRNGTIPPCERDIVESEQPVGVCILGDLPFLMKEFANGGKNLEEQFFGYGLSSARMVIECAFGRLKARFGCLRRDVDINLAELPYIIHACFILHNFCKLRKESVNEQKVQAAQKYDKEFQPPSSGNVAVNNKETGGKKIRSIFVKYLS